MRRYVSRCFSRSFAVLVALFLTSFANALSIEAKAGASTTSSRTTEITSPAASHSQVLGVMESRSRNAAAWVVSFSGSKPMHRVVRTGSVVQVYFKGAACPAPQSVRVASLASSAAMSAAYVSCSVSGGDAVMKFHAAQNQQITLRPQATSLTVGLSLRAAHPVHSHRAHGTRLAASFFQTDAMQRTSNVLQADRRQNLELLIKTNPRTQIATGARAELNTLPQLQKPVIVAQRSYSTVVNGAPISGSRVDVIARGGVENDSHIFTRLYYYVYDTRTGQLLLSGDQLAPDAIAQKYGFQKNNVGATTKEVH